MKKAGMIITILFLVLIGLGLFFLNGKLFSITDNLDCTTGSSISVSEKSFNAVDSDKGTLVLDVLVNGRGECLTGSFNVDKTFGDKIVKEDFTLSVFLKDSKQIYTIDKKSPDEMIGIFKIYKGEKLSFIESFRKSTKSWCVDKYPDIYSTDDVVAVYALDESFLLNKESLTCIVKKDTGFTGSIPNSFERSYVVGMSVNGVEKQKAIIDDNEFSTANSNYKAVFLGAVSSTSWVNYVPEYGASKLFGSNNWIIQDIENQQNGLNKLVEEYAEQSMWLSNNCIDYSKSSDLAKYDKSCNDRVEAYNRLYNSVLTSEESVIKNRNNIKDVSVDGNEITMKLEKGVGSFPKIELTLYNVDYAKVKQQQTNPKCDDTIIKTSSGLGKEGFVEVTNEGNSGQIGLRSSCSGVRFTQNPINLQAGKTSKIGYSFSKEVSKDSSGSCDIIVYDMENPTIKDTCKLDYEVKFIEDLCDVSTALRCNSDFTKTIDCNNKEVSCEFGCSYYYDDDNVYTAKCNGEAFEEICGNEIDDDFDGLVDEDCDSKFGILTIVLILLSILGATILTVIGNQWFSNKMNNKLKIFINILVWGISFVILLFIIKAIITIVASFIFILLFSMVIGFILALVVVNFLPTFNSRIKSLLILFVFVVATIIVYFISMAIVKTFEGGLFKAIF